MVGAVLVGARARAGGRGCGWKGFGPCGGRKGFGWLRLCTSDLVCGRVASNRAVPFTVRFYSQHRQG